MGISLVSDVMVAGGGIIGLSIALELRRRGLSVIVADRGHAMRAASWAAGGMLAARDPENPPALLPLSLQSLVLYPAYLNSVAAASGTDIPLRTRRTLQQIESGGMSATGSMLEEARRWIPGLVDTQKKFVWLEEESLDPRDLCRALPAAFLASQGTLLEQTPVLGIEEKNSGVSVLIPGRRIEAATFVNCCGAWAGDRSLGGLPVAPVKGQAVTVALDAHRIRAVLRTPRFYAIPRGDGRVTIGATIEHAGFDLTVEPHRIAALIAAAAELLPELAGARQLESWCGLRPATPDGLPVLGRRAEEHCWHATGHYRNGVLLAPITARVIAQAIVGERPDVPLENFSPLRFAAAAVGNRMPPASNSGA